MKHTLNKLFNRRLVLGAAVAIASAISLPAFAQTKAVLRISTPAVPDDWHAKMWTVFKDSLEKSAPGEFDARHRASSHGTRQPGTLQHLSV
jgi:TRAP-type C4-dicarboxylate transport system substrate-binding protein